MTIDDTRRRFAEDLRASSQLKSDVLVDALARVPRERFLGPGPWTIRGGSSPVTDDADPRHVYQNVSIAIDAERDLYNGQPGFVATLIDALAIHPGERVLHVGCATGYYSALLAEMTGPAGAVTAIEVDAALAARAKEALALWPWVTVRHGDGRTSLPQDVDVVLIQAGATHVLDEWLDALRDGGRLLVPLTCTIPGMPPSLSKGVILHAERHGDQWRARIGTVVMIYAMIGARDEAMNVTLGKALMGGQFASVTRLRRDRHDPDDSCWLHGTSCLGKT